MRSFFAFLKKELLEGVRSGRLIILGVLFIAFGIMSPAIAKITPWLYDVMSEALEESGMAIGQVSVDATASWVQFYKNIPMALIAFVLIYGAIFTKEYNSGTLILVLTKGQSRVKVVVAKTVVLLFGWTAGYWLCFGITYVCNDILWDNGVALGIFEGATFWWLFGVWVICLTVLLSTVTKSYGGVLLGVGGAVIASYVVSVLPKLDVYSPAYLMNGAMMMNGAVTAEKFTGAVIVTLITCIACLAASIPLINKKQI